MTHALVTLEQNAPANGVDTKAPDELKTGHISCAVELLETFANEDAEATKVQKIYGWAIVQGLTCEEFAKQCKEAVKAAATIDTANGFVPKPDAKGSEKYGPKRRLLGQRLSEAKRVFGVFKMAPDILKEKGYWPAVETARKYLDSLGLQWDGSKVETPDARKAKAQNKAEAAAIVQVRQDHPQLAGETIADWKARIDPLIDKALETAAEEVFNTRVETIVKALRKQFTGEESALLAACQFIVNEGETK